MTVDINRQQYEETLLQQALFNLRSCNTEEECKKVQYEFWKNGIGNTRLVTNLAIYKGYLLNGSSKEELEECIRVLKIPKKYAKAVVDQTTGR